MKHKGEDSREQKVLMLASVASMIDQFNMPNIRLLADMGYEVHVICNFRDGNTCDNRRIRELKDEFKDMCITWYQWDCPRNLRSFKKCYRAYQQLMRLIGEQHYSWLHCHSPVGGALARLAAHRWGIRVVYTAHGFHFYYGAPWKNWLLYYPAEKLLAHWTDILITINQEDFHFAKKKLHPGKVCYIPGVGIDCSRFQEARENTERGTFCKKYGIPENAKVLLSVGELNKGKNHKMVIDALTKLSRDDVYYLICGQGCLRKELQQYADKLGVGGRIRMPGYQEGIQWIYPNADIFVFPSLREGMPVALMEAMAAEMPCVVSDIRGNRELVMFTKGKFRACFSLKHPEQLVQSLNALLEDRQLREICGMYNREKIRRYDQEKVQKRMKKIYHSLSI